MIIYRIDGDDVRILRVVPSVTGVAPSDEYDNYVEWRASIARVRSECQKVAQQLAAIERDAMGYEQATAARNMKVAEKLCQLDAHLQLDR